MKKGAKPTFNNTLLKRWLLKVGQERRQALLAKFRADLVRLGLSRLAWRKGLLQLSSRPFVRLIPVATTQTIRKGHSKDQKSRNKGTEAAKDNNNNNNNNVDFMGQKFDHITSSFSNKEHGKYDRQNVTRVVGLAQRPECSTFGATSSQRHSSTDKLKKVKKSRGSEKRYFVGSGESSKERGRSRGKKNRSILKKGENPNGVTWRLIPIDMENPIKSPNQNFLWHRQVEKKRKKDRLCAKFIEIFGDDVDPSSSDSSYISHIRTNDSSEVRIPKRTVMSEERTETREKSNTLNRKSPIFASSKKRKRDSYPAVCNGEKKLKTADVDTSQDSILLDDKSPNTQRDYLINILQDDTMSLESTASTNLLLPHQPTVSSENVVGIEELDTDDNTTSSSRTVEILQHDKERESSSRNNCISEEEEIGTTVLNSFGLNSKREDASVATMIASPIPHEAAPLSRIRSVIIKSGKAFGEPVEASTAKLNPILQLQRAMNEELGLTITQETEAANLNLSDDDDDRSIIEIPVDNEKSEKTSLPQTLISLLNKSMKNEPVDQYKPIILPAEFLDRIPNPLADQQPHTTASTNCFLNVIENDPKPSSTTDVVSGSFRYKTLKDSAKLLGALDNIYLALDCRRRVCERKQAASKLAIEKNRQEVVLNAEREFESKLVVFREEIKYLFTRLDTWDLVLRFISQGLDHRTPSGMKPFSAAEVELAMLEAEIKVPVGNDQKESNAPITKIKSVGKVLCTIDLTLDIKEDDVMIDFCDSSTDPPRSQNYLIGKPKFEPIVDEAPECENTPNYDFQENIPSIADVKTISPQQFDGIDKIEDKFDTVSSRTDDPCYLCSRASIVACGRCARATYCSDVCHKIHWTQSHHATCVPRSEIISRYQKVVV